ncbi:MAG: hypothetical protein H0X65_08440 [Gemmatimonadetes bacterium]|nr:hypothetical protein [Gemmatimonadota bacterium]
MQGSSTPLRLRHSAGELTDGGGLLLVRRLWDRLGLGQRIDTQASWLRGECRPSLMVELWVVLLLYGGGCMDDLRLLTGRGIRRLFGWKRLPNPTTFGRWLRRGGERLAGQLDRVLWQVARRGSRFVPERSLSPSRMDCIFPPARCPSSAGPVPPLDKGPSPVRNAHMPAPNLLDPVREHIRGKHLSRRTEQAYVGLDSMVSSLP